jgi:hypothetical protein
MAELFGLSGKESIWFKVQAIACGDWNVFKLSADEALSHLTKFCEYLNFEELDAQSMVDAAYGVCQNKLLSQNKITPYNLVILPPFNEYGRSNLLDLLKAWQKQGKSGLEETFWILFRDNSQEENDSEGEDLWEDIRQEYIEAGKKLFELRNAAFEKYKTVEQANMLIDQMGFEKAEKVSTKEFLDRLEIRLTRGGLTKYERHGLIICNVLSGDWHLIDNDRYNALNLIEQFCKSADLSEGAEQVANDIFVPTQNGLMNYRKDDFHIIQREPPFSDFGRENLIKFLNSWETGGKMALEQMFNQVFSGEWKNRKPKQEIIRILSGDGETQETAIKFSTNDMQKRIRTEFCYIYYMFGKDWNHMHSTVLGNDGKAYSCWYLDFNDGTQKTVYFDINKEF